MIGDGIELTIVSVKGNRVKLGLAAPRSVPIRRQEVIRREVMPDPFHTPADEIAP